LRPCLVVGGGFIGRAVLAALGSDGRLASHRAVEEPGLLDGARAVLYAGRHPALGTAGWRLADDVEPALARRAAEAGLPFISLGSRKVYAPGAAPLAETAPLGPGGLYGRQKLEIEEALTSIPGSRLTRLRLSNIFGFERGRRSFMGLMQTRLCREGAIRFDMSPFTVRDFLPVEVAAAAVAALLRRPHADVINIGSGIPLPTGRLALWLLEGFGSGALLIEDPRERDSFVLATRRMHELTGVSCSDAVLRDACVGLGRRLREEPV
jgi:nucleoside-diphosphate-sugar epimerase